MELKDKKENKDDKKKENVKNKESNNKDTNILNRKRRRFKYKKNKNNNNNKRKLEPIEQLYQKAKNIYEAKTSPYDLDKIDFSQKVNKEKKWSNSTIYG